MPIYGYRCSSCGVQKDVLRKISDALLTACPVCGKETFSKQLSAAGFQLKGSGWYATDFKSSGSKPESKSEAKTEAKTKTEVVTSGNASAATPTASGST